MATRTRTPGVGIPAALEGAGLIAWNLAATPFVRQKRLRWGTRETEATDSLPGDELVPDPKWSYTLAIDVAATPEAVWPWIAQIGQGRGGFYTYQTVENIVGCKISNSTRIRPEFQHPEVGDDIYLHPTAPPMQIAIVEPPHHLVLFGSLVEFAAEERWGVTTWQFVLRPEADRLSRLITRGRSDFSIGWAPRLAYGRFPMEPITFVMSRKMLLEIKRLAETTAGL